MGFVLNGSFNCVSRVNPLLSARPWRGTEEVAKLQKHLALLRQEYVKMQQKLADTERRCAMLAAQNPGQTSPTSAAASTFISRLLDIVADLYLQDQYR